MTATSPGPLPPSHVDIEARLRAADELEANIDSVVAALVDDDNASETSIALSARFFRIETVNDVAVTAEAIHAALVTLGLITAAE
jgi:hypothetical protein